MKGTVGLAAVIATVLATVAASAPVQEPDQSCSLTSPELEKALDAVHAARDGSVADAKRVVDDWLPKTTRTLGSSRTASKAWLHLAVDLGRQLTRLGRTDEARKLYSRVVELDSDGDWGRKAAAHLEE